MFYFTLLAGNVICVNAESTVAVSASFNSPGEFAAMGDINYDGVFTSPDLVELKKILLGIAGYNSKYTDSNWDGGKNVLDLVHLKKDIVALKAPAIIVNGALMLDGTAFYTQDIISLLKPSSQYQISYNFT